MASFGGGFSDGVEQGSDLAGDWIDSYKEKKEEDIQY